MFKKKRKRKKATSLPRMRCLLCMRTAIHSAGNAERGRNYFSFPHEMFTTAAKFAKIRQITAVVVAR